MLKKLAHFILGRWFFVVYFSLGIVNFVVSRFCVPRMSWINSFFITLGLMTGSDPYSFKDILEPDLLIWIMAWLIHVGSWLLIPALIGLLVTDAAQDIKNEQNLRIALDGFLRDAAKAAGVRKDISKPLKEKFHSDLDEMIRKEEDT
jgi:hypothetical protein